MEENAPAAPGADDYRDMLRRLRVLVVGGGAIGQVFGTYLQAGGAEVSYFLKPKYVEDAKDGWDLHRYGLAGVRPRKHLKPIEVFTDPRYLRAKKFDQVWLCVSSPALRTGLLEALNDSCPHAVWVSFQPGIEDREYLIQRVPANKLVIGLVNFIAYQAPLHGEELWPPGIAFFIPPFTMTQVTGPEPYASAVANLLQTGGMNAGVRPDTIEAARFGSSVLIPFVMALECSAWSFSQLRGNGALVDLMINAIKDLQSAIEKSTGAFAGSFAMAQKPFLWKLALFTVPKVASFPVEEYFKYHFTKVRAQSDQMVDDFAQLCRDNAIVPRPLETLRDQWRTRRRPVPGGQDVAHAPAHPKSGAIAPAAAGPAEEQTPALQPGAAPSPGPTTGSIPAVSPAGSFESKPDDSAVEPTRPMSLSGPSKPNRLGQSAPQQAPSPAIEVDFDFDGTDDGEQIELEGRGAMLMGTNGEGLEEPTDAPADLAPHDDDDDEIFASDGAAQHRRQMPELNVELELEPLEPLEPEQDDHPRPAAPVLRTLADLDQLPAIQDRPPEPKPEPRAEPLPFAQERSDEAVPSIIIDAELETDEQPRDPMKTIKDPAPGQVHFRDAVPAEEQQDLKRQDFIQTEFANEQQNADLRNLKNRLRARLGAKKGLSPALDDED